MHLSRRLTGTVIALLAGLSISVAQAQISSTTMNTPFGAVQISRDAFNNPAITGADELAVSWVQGYLHASDRFFQMDFNRRAASGRLAELLGSAALDSDIQLRTLGLRRAAWTTWVALSDQVRGQLKAYSDGVNAWLSENPLPPEYSALELLRAETWSPVDTLTVAKLLAFQLSFSLSDIDFTIRAMAYQQAGQVAGFNGAALFSEDTHRSQPPDDRVTLPDFLGELSVGAQSEGSSSGRNKGFGSIAVDYQLGEVLPEAGILAQRWRAQISGIPMLRKALDPGKEGAGSNTWAVSGEHTASGRALIANDPHLGLGAPAIFVEERLTVTGEDGYSVGGVAFAGTPGIVQGCTENFCWGSTVHPLDVTDVYQERFLTNNLGLPTHTMYQGQPERLRLIFQSYFVNQVGDGTTDNLTRADVGLNAGGITFVVPRRNNGPVVQVDGDTGLSVQYTGWGATFEMEAFLDINRASNVAEFEAALQKFDVGSQNFMYADNDGTIAYFTSAEAPIRADLQDDLMPAGGIPPWLIRDGTGTLNHEWLAVRNPQPQQAIPFEILTPAEMPRSIGSDRGYLANANNDPVGTSLDNNPLNQLRPGGGLYYLNEGYVAYRMGRIDRELQNMIANGNVTTEDMIVLQSNHQLRDAEVIAPIIVQAFNNASANSAPAPLAAFAANSRLMEAANRLAAWDYTTPTGIQAGYDPGDNPAALPVPSAAEVDASVAATVFSVWRGQIIKNSVDAVLSAVGLSNFLPGEREAWNAVAYQLRNFSTTQGQGASGLPFFAVPGVDNPALARDLVILQSLQDALDLLASDAFAPAFNHSTNLADYRWGYLHRIVFDHPIGISPFNVPNGGGLSDLGPGLPGVARSGGYEAVDASRHNSRADSVNEFMFGAGPARRFVAEMVPGGERLQVIPGGRSGVFLSPFYSNQLPLWLTNSYHDQP